MNEAPSAGYSGTPLARKLSLKDGLRTWWEGMPATVRAEIEREGFVLDLLPAPVAPIEAAHVFVTSRATLEDAISRLLPLLAPAGSLWISWPKKSARVPTDITEDVIREVALPLGLVDVKVCAVDATCPA
jgi:hypothetical protein